jgi:hypothetical protein
MPTENELHAAALLQRLTPCADAFRRLQHITHLLANPSKPYEPPVDRPKLLKDFAAQLAVLEREADGLGAREQSVLFALAQRLA